MVEYKITYFNARARAEILRLLFAAAGVPYQDHRIEFGEWPALKEKTPFGGVKFFISFLLKIVLSN
jgi:glutathione S-transferase